MKGKFTLSQGMPQAVLDALSSREFVGKFLDEIVGDVFGAEHPRFRPAEYFEQVPDVMVAAEEGVWGVIFTLSGISRSEKREPKVFHQAMDRTVGLCIATIQGALEGDEVVQLFVNLMISGDVPLNPAVGGYSSVHESKAVWITKDHVYAHMPSEIKRRAEAHDKARSERVVREALE